MRSGNTTIDIHLYLHTTLLTRDFHADTLLPQLESCDMNPTLIAKTFLEFSQHLTRMYCRCVQCLMITRSPVLQTDSIKSLVGEGAMVPLCLESHAGANDHHKGKVQSIKSGC